MCENCQHNKRVLMEQISELSKREGELYEMLVGIMDTESESFARFSEEERQEILDAHIARSIGVRAAQYASYCDADVTEEGHLPCEFILGIWAGRALSANIEIQRDNDLRLHLGMGEN